MFFKMLAYKKCFLLILINILFWAYSEADTKTGNNRNVMTISKSCKNTYQEILKHKKHQSVIFYIKNENQDGVKTKEVPEEYYELFLTALQDKVCLCGVYDIKYQCKTSKKQNLVVISWCSETALSKNQIMHGTSFDTLKMKIGGLRTNRVDFPPWKVTKEAVVEELCSINR